VWCAFYVAGFLEPLLFADLLAIYWRLKGKSRRCFWILFAAQSWVLWITGNKFTIETKISRQPANCIYKTMLLLQQLRPCKPKVLPLLDKVIVLRSLRTFTSRPLRRMLTRKVVINGSVVCSLCVRFLGRLVNLSKLLP
jgi:hypothetical protein